MFVSIGLFETTLHFKPSQATYAKEPKLSRVSKNLSLSMFTVCSGCLLIQYMEYSFR